ncbi:chloride channel protein [Nocardioides insulae]|uniref:chloride channel protein n=1 Tax=Nocardioides insulae TaxID=394734 RepID=UPI000415B2C2|nr:chloride channel protein [Nocardioides insulae]
MAEQAAPPAGSERSALIRLLVGAAAVGIPVSLAAFAFLALLHEITHLAWEGLPDQLGFDEAPWWWPFPLLLVAGLLVGLAVRSLPGHGGHNPIDGLTITPVPMIDIPGVLLAALAGLSLGVVLGPEGPLIAIGSALALWVSRPWVSDPHSPARQVMAVAGATAAISAIFGSPLLGPVFVLEAAGLAGPALRRLTLPCLLSSGIGALVFTGLGNWTGLEIASLSLPALAGPDRPDLPDLLWTVPLAIAVALATQGIRWIARRASGWSHQRPMLGALGAALVVAACGAAYALITGHSPMDVALSGQALLEPLATSPESWSAWALVVLLVAKGLAYAVSMGALRGGPIFPAVALGATAGVLVGALPGFGTWPAMAVGMAAATATILPMPVMAGVLTVLLLGPNGVALAPLVLLGVVVAFVTARVIDERRSLPEADVTPDGPPSAAAS